MDVLILIFLVFLFFALVGFVASIRWLIRPGQHRPAEPASPDARTDLEAAKRVIDRLQVNGDLPPQVHHLITTLIEGNLGAGSETVSGTTLPAADDRPALRSLPLSPPVATVTPTVSVAMESADEEVIDAEPVAAPPIPLAAPVAVSQPQQAAITSAPWDGSPEPVTPRRTLAEWMSGFMEENNMRWGELTSGILIVMSAVGLVTSLREQLRNSIPYFPSLLFLLMTAAVHGAGIYTIRKWKLRTTSRGALIIGLLLIPLNFVAACIISGGPESAGPGAARRSLADPWLWAAVVIGIVSFSTMIWYSGKHLLKKGQLPLLISLVGCGMGTLVINRWVTPLCPGWLGGLLTLPVAVSFLIGTCAFAPNQWRRKRWTGKAVFRLYVFLGIGAFAALAGLSMVLVRGEMQRQTIISITPTITIIGAVCVALGATLKNGIRAALPAEVQMADLPGTLSNTMAVSADLPVSKLVAVALAVLGGIIGAAALIGSINLPEIFVFNAIIASASMVGLCWQQKNEGWLPLFWALLAAAIVMMVHFFCENIRFGQWMSYRQLVPILISADTAICMFAAATVAVGVSKLAGRRYVDPRRREKFHKASDLSGVMLASIAGAIALVAGFLNRVDRFDVALANLVMITLAAGAISVCFLPSKKWPRSTRQFRRIMPSLAAILVLAMAWHVLVWNLSIQNALLRLKLGQPLIVCSVAAVVGLVMTVVAATATAGHQQALKNGQKRLAVFYRLDAVSWLSWGFAAIVLLSVAVFAIIHPAGLWGTVFAITAMGIWYGWGWSFHRIARQSLKSLAATPFVISTGLLVIVFMAEHSVRWAFLPSLWSGEHFLLQLTGLAIWASVWSVFHIAVFNPNRRQHQWLDWLSCNRPRIDVMTGLLLAATAVALTLGQVVESVCLELFAGYQEKTYLQWDWNWTLVALTAIEFSILLSLLERPKLLKGLSLLVVGLAAVSLFALGFDESRSGASAVRWLVPLGGLGGALIIATGPVWVAVWSGVRTWLKIPGRSCWPRRHTQWLVNSSLAMTTMVVLAISTVTVSQVLLSGKAALGGPQPASWFRSIPVEVSFGGPIAIIVGTFLLLAISQRRSILASIGSMVFQYIVLLAVVLLYTSPHPKLASTWFINILLAVSLGMTGYGIVWLMAIGRIGDRPVFGNYSAFASGSSQSVTGMRQIALHTTINGVLIASVSALAIGRFLIYPAQPGGWISSVGGPLGILSVIAYGVLATLIWMQRLGKQFPSVAWEVWVGCLGMIWVGLLSAIADRWFAGQDFIPWLSFRMVAIGTLAVVSMQCWLLWQQIPRSLPNGQVIANPGRLRYQVTQAKFWLRWFAFSMPATVGLIFATVGAVHAPTHVWLYFLLMLQLLLYCIVAGMVASSLRLQLLSLLLSCYIAAIFQMVDPLGWFVQTNWSSHAFVAIAVSLTATVWTMHALWLAYRRRGMIERRLMILPNIVVLLAAIRTGYTGMAYILFDTSGNLGPWLWNQAAVATTVVLYGVLAWSGRAKFRLFVPVCVSLTVLAGAAVDCSELRWVVAQGATPMRWAVVTLAAAATVLLWGWILNRQHYWMRRLRRWKQPRIASLKRRLNRRLPIYSSGVSVVVLLMAVAYVLFSDSKALRTVVALSPFLMAIALGLQAKPSGRRYVQLGALSLATVGVLFLAWACLPAVPVLESSAVRFLGQTLVAGSALSFVYAGVVPRWVVADDGWMRSLSQMAIAISVITLATLFVTVGFEAMAFQPEVGCGLTTAESVTVALTIFFMVAGLIAAATERLGLSLNFSIRAREGLVYTAQAVLVGLAVHFYLSMPWLFQFGILKYWPYLMMAICFMGVGLAEVLKKRDLTVLGRPLFHTAAALPVAVAAGMFAFQSEANVSVVMLSVGMIYLLVGYMQKSVLSSAGSIVFASLALWTFLEPRLSFFEHPQLWMIPPAIAVLIASQLLKDAIPAKVLQSIRYFCVAAIYVSSTSEIFIHGIGDSLWPPMVLASLAVMGVLVGILLEIKAYLYFGSLFLLLAMTSMVAHAHQRLEHVWPWWAFGIGLGIAILVMFGLFEKRKNEMKSIAEELKNWE